MTERPPPMRPMIKQICANSGGAFTGLGRHLANDLCFHLAIHPATPAIYMCQDEERFAELLNGIPGYLDRFIQPSYHDTMAASCCLGQENPFEFHEHANRTYLHSFVDVFRRCSVQVDGNLYVKYITQGLLDRRHTIGELFYFN